MLFRKLVHTSDDALLLMSRFALGVVFFAHGAQKALGWFGGPGFEPTVQGFGHLGIPAFLAVLAIAAEFLGGLGLILGCLSRIAAFGITVNMIVAIAAVHAPNGFFMNWTGHQAGEGFEFHLLALALLIVTLVRGAGAFSIDLALDRWLAGGRTVPMGMHPHPVR